MRLLQRLIGAYSNDNLGLAARRFTYDVMYSKLFGNVVRIQGQLMCIDGHFPAPHDALPSSTHEEPAFSRFLYEVGPNMTVVDVGAGSGWFTLNAADRVRPDGEVHAFEIDEDRFASLQKNIKLNGYTNITTYNVEINENSPISDFVKNVDLAVVDVEGKELEALQGLPGIDNTEHPMVIFCEIHPDLISENEQEDINKFLGKYHFQLSYGSPHGEFLEDQSLIKDELHQLLAVRGSK